MSPAQELLHRHLDHRATFNADALSPRELFALGRALAILEGAETCR